MNRTSLQKTKKLRLSTETLRRLDASDLALIAGGAIPTNSVYDTECNCPKPNPY